MKKIVVIILLLASAAWRQTAIAQQEDNCDINDRLSIRSADTILIDEASEQDFIEHRPKEQLHLTYLNRDSLEQVLVNRYDLIEKKDSCIQINFAGQKLKFCSVNTNDKTYGDYQFTSYQDEKYLTIYETGYESWTHYFLDFKDSIIYNLPGMPQIIDEKYLFGESHYYGEHDFKIYNMETKDILDFIIGDVLIKEVYMKDGVIRFKAQNLCNKDNSLKYKYYQIDVECGL